MQSNEIDFCEKIQHRRLSKTSLSESFQEAQSLLLIPKNSLDPALLNLIAITHAMLAVVEDCGRKQELEGKEPALSLIHI